MADKESFYGRWYGNKVRRRWWSLLNWLQGYQFGPVRRCKQCDHTTPSHYGWCGAVAVPPLLLAWERRKLAVSERWYALTHRKVV